MNNLIKLSVIALAMLCNCPIALAGNYLEHWLEAHVSLPKSKPPFSFIYRGKEFLTIYSSWEVVTNHDVIDSNRERWTVTYSEPKGGLSVRLEVITYMQYEALEWALYVESYGGKDTGIISNVRSIKLNLAEYFTGPYVVKFTPVRRGTPTDYVMQSKKMTSTDSYVFSPKGGRSSDWYLPFFRIEEQGQQRGVITAVGWSGQWIAEFSGEHPASYQAGLESAAFSLSVTNEEMKLPSTLIMFWEGETHDSHNSFRKLLRRYVIPEREANLAFGAVAADSTRSVAPDALDELGLRTFIENTYENGMPVGILSVGPGWYEKVHCKSEGEIVDGEHCAAVCSRKPGYTWLNTGSWRPDKERFPDDSLGAVMKWGKDKGYRMGLWIEPERVTPGSLLSDKKDWLLTSPVPDQDGCKYSLLNLGNPDVLDWMKNHFSKLVTDLEIEVLHLDINANLLETWKAADQSDQVGLVEIRYINGLYDFIDHMRSEHQNLIIDNLAEGGLRHDIEMMRRSVYLAGDSHLATPTRDSLRTLREKCGVSYWFPYSGSTISSIDDIGVSVGSYIATRLNHDKGAGKDPGSIWYPGTQPYSAKTLVQFYRQHTYLFDGDYFALAVNPDWLICQFVDTYNQQAIIQGYALKTASSKVQLVLPQGLDPFGLYKVFAHGEPEHVFKYGSELMTKGITLTVPEIPGLSTLIFSRFD